MPKKKLPYYDRKGYAYVYVNRQPVSLKSPNGRRCKTGTPEAMSAYLRHSLGIDDSPTPNEHNVTITELSAGYLTHLKTKRHDNYDTVKTVVDDFLHALYGDGYPVDAFTPKCLKNLREMMIKSQRLCRRTLIRLRRTNRRHLCIGRGRRTGEGNNAPSLETCQAVGKGISGYVGQCPS